MGAHFSSTGHVPRYDSSSRERERSRRRRVARADAEVFNAERNQFRVELLGSADVITAVVENGRVVAIEISEVRFSRQGS